MPFSLLCRYLAFQNRTEYHILEAIPVDNSLAIGFPSALLEPQARCALRSCRSRWPSKGRDQQRPDDVSYAQYYRKWWRELLKASNWFNIPASLFGTVAGNLVQPLLNKKQLENPVRSSEDRKGKQYCNSAKPYCMLCGEVSDALVKREKLETQYEIAEQRGSTLQQKRPAMPICYSRAVWPITWK